MTDPSVSPNRSKPVAVLAWRQYRIERRMFWRNPSAAFFNFLLPILLLLLFGAVFSGSSSNLDVIVPGIAGMGVMASTFSALAFNLTFLREQGVLKRMRGTPMPPAAYLTGVLANAVTNAAIQIGIVILVARFVFGVGWPRNWAELVFFVAIGVTCFGALGIAFSHLIPNFDAAPAYVNAVFLPMIFIRVLPLTHLIDGLSAAMVTGAPLSTLWGSVGVVLLWGLVGVIFAIRGFSWESRS